MQNAPDSSADSPSGIAFAIGAYGLWGFLPLYLKLVEHMPAVEVLIHRVLWSLPVAALVLLVTRRFSDVVAVLKTPRLLAMVALTAGLISLNWVTYIWAIANDRALDAAMGYYMNPLFSVALGALMLGEKLSRWQWVAIGLACIAVTILTVHNGNLPWVSVVLGLSFAFYGFFRKTLPLGANQGFFLEVALLVPPAFAVALWFGPEGHFLTTGWRDTVLLLGCGLVTALPLILYGNAAKRLRLSTIGILQYIAPTMIMGVAVLVFGEPFGPARAIAFPLIWLALVIYTAAMIRDMRAARAA